MTIGFSVGDSTEGDRTHRIIVSLADFTSTLARQASGKVCTQSTVEDIVQQLLLLAGMTSQPALSGFSVAVQTTLEAAMQLLSAVNFFTVVERLLDSSNDQVGRF